MAMLNRSEERFSKRSTGWSFNVYILWFGTFTAQVGFSLVMPFLPQFVGELGVGGREELFSGIVISASYLASAVMAPVWGSLSDRYGRKLMIIRSGLGMGILYLVSARAQTFPEFLALRTINGLIAGYIPSSIALIAANTPQEHLGWAMGMIQSGVAGGTIFGPIVGGALAAWLGVRMTLVMAGVFILAATAPVVFWVKEDRKSLSQDRTNILRDMRLGLGITDLRAMIVTSFILNAVTTAVQPVLPGFVMDLGIGQHAAALASGTVFSVTGISMVVGAPIWARYSKKAGERCVLLLTLVASGLLHIPQALSSTVSQLAVGRFVAGGFLAGILPVSQAIAASAVEPGFRGRAFGLVNAVTMLGGVAGPSAGGFIGECLGNRAVFLAAGAALISNGLWLKTFVWKRNPNSTPSKLVRENRR